MSTQHSLVGPSFAGFEPLSGNFLYCPNQFFDVCLPHHSRGTVRLVAYLLRKTLGWLDEQGQPVQQEIQVSYGDLIEGARISRGAIRSTIDEALQGNFITCIRDGRPKRSGASSQSARYKLCWDEGTYTKDPATFGGFFAGEGNRSPIPNAFFDHVVLEEPLAVAKVVGTVLRHTVGYESQFGRRDQAPLAYSYIQNYAQLRGRATLGAALKRAIERGYVQCVEAGKFAARASERRTASYRVRWLREAAPVPLGSKTEPGQQFNNRTSQSSKKKPADPSKKRTRIGSESAPVEQFKNRPIEKKLLNNTDKQTPDGAVVDLNQSTIELLRAAGFDRLCSNRIAAEFPRSQILRQLSWLPQRGALENQVGMLRRAIEEDWSPPPAALAAEKRQQQKQRSQQQQQSQQIADQQIEQQKREADAWRESILPYWSALSPDWLLHYTQQAILRAASRFDQERLRHSDPFAPESEVLEELARDRGLLLLANV